MLAPDVPQTYILHCVHVTSRRADSVELDLVDLVELDLVDLVDRADLVDRVDLDLLLEQEHQPVYRITTFISTIHMSEGAPAHLKQYCLWPQIELRSPSCFYMMVAASRPVCQQVCQTISMTQNQSNTGTLMPISQGLLEEVLLELQSRMNVGKSTI